MIQNEEDSQTTPERPLAPSEQPKPTTWAEKLAHSWEQVRVPLWGKLVLLMGLIFLASIGYLRSTLLAPHHPDVLPTEEDIKAIESRQPLPELVLLGTDESQVKLSQFKGKVVILSFWASWCAPCLVEMPMFKQLHNELQDRGLEVVPVNVDENPQDAKDFISKFWAAEQIPFRNYTDPKRLAVKHLQVDTLPSNFVIDREGRLVFTATGANDWTKGPTMDLLEMLLAEK